MSSQEIDAYIQAQPEPQRSTLTHLREQILVVIPDAEQCISYAMPAFKVKGKTIAFIAGYKNHIGYYPHGRDAFVILRDELSGYFISEKGGGVHFPIDKPVPDTLIEQLVTVRLGLAFPNK